MSTANLQCLAAVLMLVGRPALAEPQAGAAEVRAFARAPAFALASISPDGARLAYVEQENDKQRVVVRLWRADREQRTLTVESRRERVRWCDWSGDQWLLCGTILPVRKPDRVGERTRLYAIDTSGGQVHELNKRLPGNVHDAVIDLLPQRPEHVLLQHDRAGQGYPEVVELDVGSGTLRQVVNDRPPVRRWLSDAQGEVRLGLGFEGSTAAVFLRQSAGDEWRLLLEQALSDIDAVGPLGFGAQPDELLVLKHHEGRAALFRIDTDSPTVARLLFADPVYDVSGPVVADPASGQLLAVDYLAEHAQRHFFSAAEAKRQAWLDGQLPGKVNRVMDRSLDGRLQLVRSGNDTDPPTLYIWDTSAAKLILLGDEYPALENRRLAPMRPIVYEARDGQRIPGYLTVPLGLQPGRRPAIVLPHGGPETRDALSFDPLVQFLAARGFLVLQMNFRGSLGYGAGFAAAGAGQWGGVIHNDITDGAHWLIETGLADPTRICIVGASFGGYAAMLAAARESEWYACAVSYAGVSDLMALAQYVTRVQGAEIWEERMGTDQRALWQMSPLARVRFVEMPLLVVHGRLDATVPVSQSRRFVRELRHEAKTPQYIERPDCDHEMTIEACRLTFFEELQRFLLQHLGNVAS